MTLQVFVSLMLAVGSILLFAIAFRQRDFEHADRLALLPLESSEPGPRTSSGPEATRGTKSANGTHTHSEQSPKKDDNEQ